jgi:alkylation response protein AidB-like acyl-CoA dehydrogenase
VSGLGQSAPGSVAAEVGDTAREPKTWRAPMSEQETHQPTPLRALTTRPDLVARFEPILAEVATGAVRRELQRELPFAAVEQLRAAGFGALRVPVEYGGGGLSFVELVDLLVDLARADSNLTQLFRGHIGFVEELLAQPASAAREFWFKEVATGALVGNAVSERGASPLTAPETRLVHSNEGWTIAGTKYYSTGSLFADWIYTIGLHKGEIAKALVRSDAKGVERRDDWDGFGQRLTGSGTTVFSDAEVDADHVTIIHGNELPLNSQQAIFQVVHLATLTGIAQAARDDAISFVRRRTRSGYDAQVALPREDPQIQQVVGEVASLVFTVTATTRAAAAVVEELQAKERRGGATADDYGDAEASVFLAQGTVIELTLRATSDLFRVGGASATGKGLAFDRYWRNARTVSSHHPEVFRARIVGNYLLNGGSLSKIAFGSGGRGPDASVPAAADR